MDLVPLLANMQLGLLEFLLSEQGGGGWGVGGAIRLSAKRPTVARGCILTRLMNYFPGPADAFGLNDTL